MAAIEIIQEVIPEAIEADVSSVTGPDTTLFEHSPGSGEDIAEMVVYAGQSWSGCNRKRNSRLPWRCSVDTSNEEVTLSRYGAVESRSDRR